MQTLFHHLKTTFPLRMLIQLFGKQESLHLKVNQVQQQFAMNDQKKLQKQARLQKQYDQANSMTKNLQQQEQEVIANYRMKEGDYKILITVYEANDLIPRPADFLLFNADKSACDAFVQIQIRGQKKKTQIRNGTNNPIWQEPFYFHFENMSVEELDRSKIFFNLYDKNHFIIADSQLGQFQLDWTNVYFRRFHEIYRGWLTLSDPKQEISGPVGYLLVNISVLGPEDKIMVHDSAFIKDPLTTIEDTITNTKTPLIDYSLNVQVYRAENLVPLDLASRSVDAYAVAKFSGNKVNTQIVSSLNPEWNQSLKIGTGVPNKTKYIMLQIWNRNRLSRDDLIGTIKIPFIDVMEDRYIEPRWGHLYGPPLTAVDKEPAMYATKMQIYGQDLGSHYRGRVLYKVIGKKYVHGKNGTNKIQFKFPFKPTPVVPLKTYTLSVELLQGFQLPQRPEAMIHVAMGQYMIKSKPYKVQKKMCEFLEVLQDKKVQFPEDIEQVPDIIVYFCDGKEENNRMSFIRVKASKAVTNKRHKYSHIQELQGDKSLDLLAPKQIGGYLVCRINLYTNAAPQYKPIEIEYKEKYPYTLMFYLYKGEEFPPANIKGDCDPMIKFNCHGQTKQSKPVTGSFNPFWQQTIRLDVMLQDIFSTTITKGIVCQGFDYEEQGNHQYIGSFLLELNSNQSNTLKPKEPTSKAINFIYQKPKWFYIKNPHVEIGKNVFGKVLLSFALFKREDITKKLVPAQFLGETPGFQLIPKEEKLIQVYLIGLRDIRDASKKILSQGKTQVVMKLGDVQFRSNMVVLKRSGCQINELVDCKVKIPKNKGLIPYVDFKVMHENTFYGFNSVSLYKLLPKLKEKQGLSQAQREDSQDTIVDVQGLQQQLQLLKQKRKQDKLNNNIKNEFQGEIQTLPAPLELGLIKQEQIDLNSIEFDNLIKVFESNYLTNPDFQYVRALQLARDAGQRRHATESQDKNDEKEFNRMSIEEQHEHSEIKSNVNVTNALNRNTIEVSQSKVENKQDKQKEKQKNKNKPTIFDALKKKVEEKQKSKHEESMNKSMNKSKNHEKQLKSFKETALNQIKIDIQDQQEVPFQKKSLIDQEKSVHKSQRLSQMDQAEIVARNKKKSEIALANSEADLKKHHNQASKRYTLDNRDRKSQMDRRSLMDRKSEMSKGVIDQQQQFNNPHVEIRTDQQFSDVPVEQRAINFKDVERVMNQEEKDEKQARERDAEYRFGNAVKLTLFGWNRKKKRKDIQTYDDFDTEEGEDLNIIPEWYKGRKILTSDFEDLNFKATKIQTIPLFGGQKLQNSLFHTKKKENAGHIKMIIMSQNSDVAKQKQEYYTKLLKPKEYYCRIYVLKGKSLISGYDVKPSTYLRFTYADQVVSMKDKTYVKEETNPEYYICYELPLNLPGPCLVKLQVVETHYILGAFMDKVLGYTEIDLQHRYFMRRWHLYEKKPIELRNLYSQYGMGSQGRIETFIELIQKKKWLNTPQHPIAPPPFIKYELRVIIWKTDDCVFKNIEMESNDVYVRGTVGTSEPQETDTHWACRSVGNFNYRFKFPVNYPPKPEDMYSDIFTIQIWDRDLIGYNNLIGETRINLNKMHRIIQKAVKRKKPTQAKMKIKEKNFAITDRFWFDVYNNKEKDQFGIPQPQGRVQMSFELVPFEEAEKELANGFGRSDPNVYPTLQDPQGRLSFDFFSPLSFIKQIIGPKLYARWCSKFLCCLLCVLFALFGYIFLPTLLAVKI